MAIAQATEAVQLAMREQGLTFAEPRVRITLDGKFLPYQFDDI